EHRAFSGATPETANRGREQVGLFAPAVRFNGTRRYLPTVIAIGAKPSGVAPGPSGIRPLVPGCTPPGESGAAGVIGITPPPGCIPAPGAGVVGPGRTPEPNACGRFPIEPSPAPVGTVVVV